MRKATQRPQLQKYCDAFADVDGWDLQHTRRVRWFPNTANSFPVKTLGGQVCTFAAVNVESVRAWVQGLEIAEADLVRDLASLPEAGKEIGEVELGKRLFIEGLPSPTFAVRWHFWLFLVQNGA